MGDDMEFSSLNELLLQYIFNVNFNDLVRTNIRIIIIKTEKDKQIYCCVYDTYLDGKLMSGLELFI